jgi:hypothetical protein
MDYKELIPKLVCTMAAICIMLPHHLAAGEPYDELLLRKDVLYGELVVRGTVTSISSVMVPYDSLVPSIEEDVLFPVSVIDVEIHDVIKGAWTQNHVQAYLPGDPKLGGFSMDVKYDYAVAEEVILCLHYDPRLLGGVFRLWGDWGSFVKREGVWLARRISDKEVCLDSIERIAREAEPPRMFDEADAVILGSIEDVVRRELGTGERGVADHIAVRVEESWKGPSTGETVLVRAIRKGTNLPWYAPVPRLSAGESYFMFLKRDHAGFYPFIGFNGFLKVSGDQLVMNGRVMYPLSKSKMIATMREAAER